MHAAPEPRHRRHRGARWLPALLLLAAAAIAAAAPDATPPAAGPPLPAPAAAARPGGPAPAPLGHRLLWYLPNRLLDLADILRLRARVGPGLAAEARLTYYAANFVGTYRSLYLGLPGPRRAPVLPRLAGREAWTGLMVMGVDATDASPHPPHYTESEVTAGIHLALVGLDVGVDPVELGDFLAGWLLADISGDDL